jgi:hypothetical protein
MKHNFYLWLILFLFSKASFTQPSQGAACNCQDNLRRLISKTEENYAGYPSKVNNNTKIPYKKLIQQLEAKAKYETNPKLCFYILEKYVKFFADKHFTLSYNNENDFNNEVISLTEDDFKKNSSKRKLDAIEGIWMNADSTMKLAIQKFPNNIYKAIVIQTQDPKIPLGLVYATLRRNNEKFFVKEYNYFITTEIPAKVRGNLLQLGFLSMYGKIFPNILSNTEKEELTTWRDNNNGLHFKKLSAKTSYFKIPTFQKNEEKIQELVTQNDSVIRGCENLIIDLRGNGGGSTGWVSLIPYFITNPIVQYDTYLRVTPENIHLKLADLEPFAVNPIPEEYKKYFPAEISAAYKKAYQELPTTTKKFYPIPGVTFPLDSILKNPRKIALVVDDFCGSSTEYFFFLTKQSKKTRTYGINTIGMMDYEGVSNLTQMPYSNFYLSIPIVRSSWTDKKPIDKIGFKPDIMLDMIEQNKWIDYIKQDLEKQYLF